MHITASWLVVTAQLAFVASSIHCILGEEATLSPVLKGRRGSWSRKKG
jgi:hypothetical protein